MGVNLDKPHLWKADVAASVDMYNEWFMEFAPVAFRETRIAVTKDVEQTLERTGNLANITAGVLREHPEVLSTLRMSTCPPLAVDRLIGLSGVSPSLVRSMEKGRLPTRLKSSALVAELEKLVDIIERMADPDVFSWLDSESEPTEADVYRAATIVADRLCGSVANPIIRNAQEKRQLRVIGAWLDSRGYSFTPTGSGLSFDKLPAGSYAFHMNVPVKQGEEKTVKLPVDVVVAAPTMVSGEIPLLIEAKSAGDFTNVNKRRKEEATKMAQLAQTYGENVKFVLFLCGYFDSGYLGYEAAEGIDWIWEHRIDDLEKLCL